MRRVVLGFVARVGALFALVASFPGCGDDDEGSAKQQTPLGPCEPDESAGVPAREKTEAWLRVDIPEATCSNGTPYAIFVNYSKTSNNLVVMLEPGGACWDYGSCSPTGGLRGAANPNGLKPGTAHMDRFQFLPLLRPDEINPVRAWNKVFIPYCTGDIHAGNNTATYTGPSGEKLEFRHRGHDNVKRAVAWINQAFTNVPRLLATGCSAGGSGAIINYHTIRSGVSGSQCGYLLDDSGPIFPSNGPSKALHAKVRESWNTDSTIDGMRDVLAKVGVKPEDLKADSGRLNTALADLYPRDRLAIAVYRWDLNYSLYSYETFHDNPPYTRIHELWEEDLTNLRKLYETRKNLGYYMPFFRTDNCSHCVTIPPIGIDGQDNARALAEPWGGSEIQQSSLNVRDYTVHLLDDSQPLKSYLEGEQAGEGFTTDQAAICQAL
jgi:hypothetical protein